MLVVEYQADKTTSNISSDPFHICLCETNLPDCSEVTKTLSVYPGETFQVSVVTVGQGNGIVPAAVKSNMDEGRLLNSQHIQHTTKKCTILNYTVFSQWTFSQLELYADGPCSTFGDKFTFRLNVNHTCPSGFNISREESACICDEALQKYTNHCSITNGLGKIKCESDDRFWIGYDQSYGLTVHPHCPLDYCVNGTVVFPLNNTDIQCANNRSGLLCGACNSRGISLVLGIYFSLQTMHKQPSSLTDSFCADGSSTGLPAPSLQADSGNRNTQRPSVLCQYCRSQSCIVSAS